MEKLAPEKAKWLAERYYKGMEKRDPSMAKIFSGKGRKELNPDT